MPETPQPPRREVMYRLCPHCRLAQQELVVVERQGYPQELWQCVGCHAMDGIYSMAEEGWP